jgi:hypothetical protein
MALLESREHEHEREREHERSLRRPVRSTTPSREAMRARKKFLRYFKGGFRDETYVDWERGYKQAAHARWNADLDEATFRALLAKSDHAEIARRAIGLESRTNLLFSFEKMAIRDAVKAPGGAKAFATGLFDLLHGPDDVKQRFERWVTVVSELPRKQTRVLTWPLVTVFGFIAQPKQHIFLKPNVTRRAAKAYGYDFEYRSRPSWEGYERLLDFAAVVRRDLRDMRPRDMIDIQSFLWVQGSDEYPD